jgi:signal transduction histidine kinase
MSDQPVASPRRLYRVVEGRAIAGVAAGLAQHLRVDVRFVRLAFVGLTLASGAGLAMYAAFWALVPLAPDPEAPDADADDGGLDLGWVASLAALGLGVVLLAQLVGVPGGASVGIPLVLAGVGVVILWRQADDSARARWRAATTSTVAGRPAHVVRAILGVVLVLGGAVLLLLTRGGVGEAGGFLLATLVLLAGIALIAGPFVLRLVRDLGAERAARIREQERAELAAHVHDSVLHTLTLIQRQVDDPRAVARLARAQERELRGWLYHPAADPDTTLAAALERVAAEVEDGHDVSVEVVVVGDATLDDRLAALLQAAREALVNAAKYAGAAGPISVYGEVEAGQVTVFVRDRGAGFALEDVPADRMGVRESILGRMSRNGGRAVVRSEPGAGTEIELDMPREGAS